MSIKSDKWIRRMAQEHGMIEPFVERQVRTEALSVLFRMVCLVMVTMCVVRMNLRYLPTCTQ